MSYMKFFPAEGEPRLVKVEDKEKWYDQAKALVCVPPVPGCLYGHKIGEWPDEEENRVICDLWARHKKQPENSRVRMQGYYRLGVRVWGNLVMLPEKEGEFFGEDATLEINCTNSGTT